MKNITRIVVLMSLIACVLLSVVSCNLPFIPMETTTNDEITGTTTPEEDTPDDLYTLEMQTVFEMARNAGYTGTLEELIAMFRGEAGPAGKDGVTPHIGANGNWWVGDTDLGVPAQGVQGPQGEPGRGILKMEIVNGELIVYYTDGTSQNLGPIVNTDPDVPGTTPPEQTTPEPPPVVTPPVEEPDYEMPDKVDLGGYTYRAYVRSNVASGNPVEDGNPAFYCEDFWVDSSQGERDALSYSVYMRNTEIENDYNVKIRQVNQNINMTEELARYYVNGECFDLTIILAKSAANAAVMNLLTDLNSLSDLNLDHEAYDQNSIKELAIANKLYFLSGDMNISTMDNLAPTVVNMELYDNYIEAIIEHFDGDVDYADIYNLVAKGKWTVGNMLEIAELASLDMDTSDGDLGACEWDQVGYFQYSQSAIYYFYGIGGRITEMNEESVPEFIIQTSKNQELFDYLFDSLHPTQRDTRYPTGFSGARKQLFVTYGNTLFTDMTLWDVRKDLYLNGDFEYGILPTPVYEEGDDYNTVVYFYNTVHLWAIPSLCEDIDRAQIMMDVMAAYSNVNKPGSTMDAYYTRTLYFSIAPNPDARRVMDILKNSTVYDIALLYDWGGWASELSDLWWKRSTNNYGSLVSLIPNNAQPKLEATIEQFKNPVFSY